jgi:hypothetical protein
MSLVPSKDEFSCKRGSTTKKGDETGELI